MDDDLTSRLRELGRRPVPPATSAAHLTAMSAVRPDATRSSRRFGRLAVGLAAITGFLVGGSGLAMAGALPGPVQAGAAGVLAQVGVDAPDGHRNRGSCVSAIARAQGGDGEAPARAARPEEERTEEERTEEERTEEERAASEQAKDACPKGGRGPGARAEGEQCRGKPVEGETCVRGAGRTGGGRGSAPAKPTPPGLERDAASCGGPPPWAGGRLSKQEKRGAQAARAAACGTQDQASEPQPGAPVEPGVGEPEGEPGG